MDSIHKFVSQKRSCELWIDQVGLLSAQVGVEERMGFFTLGFRQTGIVRRDGMGG